MTKFHAPGTFNTCPHTCGFVCGCVFPHMILAISSSFPLESDRNCCWWKLLTVNRRRGSSKLSLRKAGWWVAWMELIKSFMRRLPPFVILLIEDEWVGWVNISTPLTRRQLQKPHNSAHQHACWQRRDAEENNNGTGDKPKCELDMILAGGGFAFSGLSRPAKVVPWSASSAQ